MAQISRQIGWSQESNLLYQILNQLNKLTSVLFGLKPKYKVYTALLSQIDENAPEPIILENTIDETLTWTYDTLGQYFLSLSPFTGSGPFIVGKTVVFIGNGALNDSPLYANNITNAGILQNSTIVVRNFFEGNPANNFTNVSIEIRVYN
jgi:hypothetical protein